MKLGVIIGIIVLIVFLILISGFLYLNFNPELKCKLMGDLDKKNICYHNVAQKTQDFNFCDDIEDVERNIDKCYQGLDIFYHDEYIVINYTPREFVVFRDIAYEKENLPITRLKVKRAEPYTAIQLFGKISISRGAGDENVTKLYELYLEIQEENKLKGLPQTSNSELIEISDITYIKRSIVGGDFIYYQIHEKGLRFSLDLAYNYYDYPDYVGEREKISEKDVEDFEDFLSRIIIRDN